MRSCRQGGEQEWLTYRANEQQYNQNSWFLT